MQLLINSTYFKQFTPASNNTDANIQIEPIIFQAQIKYIKPILCEDLYDDIISGVTNNNLSTDNDFIYQNYIKPALAYYTYYLYVPFNWVKLRDAGLVKQKSDSFDIADKSEVDFIRNTALESAQTYAIELQTYLTKNRQLYPRWCAPCDRSELYKNFIIAI